MAMAPDDLKYYHEHSGQRTEGDPNLDIPGNYTPSSSVWAAKNNGHRIMAPVFVGAIQAATATVVYSLADEPDMWLVQAPNIAGVEVEVHVGASTGIGPHARLGPGGWCRLPARGEYITLKGIGSTAFFPVITGYAGFGQIAMADVCVAPGGTVLI